MSENDRIILDQILHQRKAAIDPDSTNDAFFELFCAEQILKDWDLSYEELDSGLVGNGGDGGIDGLYVFVNDELVPEDPDYSHLRKNIDLHLVIIQAKTSAGFKETPVERLLTVSEDLLDLSKTLDALRTVYNPLVRAAFERFREVHGQLAARFPVLRLSYYYATKGGAVHENVRRKADKIEEAVHRHFPTAEFTFNFLGASKLLALARRQPQTVHELVLAENPISSGGQIGFVCLVRLRDFFSFITDGEEHIRRAIFEANVRDYQGRTEVNDAIQSSLTDPGSEDFWWLNNGVTIVAGRASQSGKKLTIEDPQIVNGLQTSTEVYNYFKRYNTERDHRTVLVRVVVPSEPASRDRIIKATNRQTMVPQASLRATDKIHRDIEEYLRPRGLYYDRRKNYYKNEGKPRERIIGIPYLAQAVMAITLGRPDTARARPSSLLKKDDDYVRVYNLEYPLHLYYVCAVVMWRVETFLRSSVSRLAAKDRNNLRFYVAREAVCTALGDRKPTIASIAGVRPESIDVACIEEALSRVKSLYDDLGADDQVAKGAKLLGGLESEEKEGV